MTAWLNVQHEWAQNTEEDLVTGVLLWDLPAAFDTLDPELYYIILYSIMILYYD